MLRRDVPHCYMPGSATETIAETVPNFECPRSVSEFGLSVQASSQGPSKRIPLHQDEPAMRDPKSAFFHNLTDVKSNLIKPWSETSIVLAFSGFELFLADLK